MVLSKLPQRRAKPCSRILISAKGIPVSASEQLTGCVTGETPEDITYLLWPFNYMEEGAVSSMRTVWTKGRELILVFRTESGFIKSPPSQLHGAAAGF